MADLIFGLALSVGAISLVSTPPTSTHEVFGDVITFGFSFLILIAMWLRYTRIMSVFPLETRRVVILNIALLFSVSIEPFLFNLVTKPPPPSVLTSSPSGFGDATSTLYGLDLAAMFLILGGFTLTLASEERKLIPKSLIRQYRFEGASWFFCGLIFLVSALPPFWAVQLGGMQLRYYLWSIPLLLLRVLTRAIERIAKTDDAS